MMAVQRASPKGPGSSETGRDQAGAGRHFVHDLFDGVASSYDFWAQALGLFQYIRWRRALVSRALPRGSPATLALDVCTGTAGVAAELAHRVGARVIGLDLSRGMLQAGRDNLVKRGLAGPVELVQGRAERLPFPDGTFDAVVFTFLLRYVADPPATLRELVRVLKPSGQLVSLEFAVPENPAVRALWTVYARVVLPGATALISRGWRRVGGFLGPSIARFYRQHTVAGVAGMWRDAGMTDVEVSRLSLGGAIVMSGTKRG